MQIEVMSRRELEKAKLNDGVSYAIISIGDPNFQPIKLKKSAQIKDDKILRLEFYDVIKKSFKYYPISEQDSIKIAKFIRKIRKNTDVLIVQCEAGISRSAGVAAAISKWMWDKDDIYFDFNRFIPNMKCYEETLRAFYRTSNILTK